MYYTLKEMQEETTGFLKAAISVCEKNDITYWCQAGTVLGAVRHKGPIPWDEDADIIIPNNQIERFVQCCVEDLPREYWVDYHTVHPQGYRLFPRIGKRGYSTQHLHLDIFRLIGIPADPALQLSMVQHGKKYEVHSKFYDREWKGKYRIFLGPIKNLQPKELWDRVKTLSRGDKSFVEKMDEMCERYPFEKAQYVMNPCGSYGLKNVFLKEIYGEGKTVPYLDFEVRIPSETDIYLKQYYGNYMEFPPKKVIGKNENKRYKVDKLGI